jgi:phytoene dehydrogenase-like protein
MSCFVQYAPYHLKDANWDAERERFGDVVIDTLSEYAPNLKSLILHRQVITPLDLEREWGLSEGNIFQGELALEQLLFLRPIPGGPGIERLSTTSTCAARRRILAAASWARQVATPALEVLGPSFAASPLRRGKVTDVIFVGGGHNGLAAAALVARGGAKTLVLEAP